MSAHGALPTELPVASLMPVLRCRSGEGVLLSPIPTLC